MKKILVNNDQEFISIFNNMDVEKVEDLLGVEFAFEDGTFLSDVEIDNLTTEIENQDIDRNNWRKLDENIFPEQYPCVFVHLFKKTFDKLGSVEFQFYDFVYLTDFETGDMPKDDTEDFLE